MLLFGLCLVGSEHIPCTQCQPGTYCFEDMRYTCPAHSMSPSQAGHVDDCTCLQGYHKVNNSDPSSGFTCVECGADVYCTLNVKYDCEQHASSPPLSSSIDDCQCNAGYTGGDPCTECIAGKYKITTADSACLSCPANTYSTTVAAITPDTCLDCPAHSSSPVASDEFSDCTCNDQYEPWELLCIPECKALSARSEPGGDCFCLPGYTGADGLAPLYDTTCIACDVGYFKTESGSASCLPCPERTYSINLASTQCQACHNNSFSSQASTSLSSCLCEAGYEKIGSDCLPCQPGYYKGDISDSPCQQCPAGSISTATAIQCDLCLAGTYQHETGKTSCRTCTDHSSSVDGSAGCECNQGHEPVCESCTAFLIDTDPPLLTPEASCSPCRTGFYKEVVYNQACDTCTAGKYTVNTAVTTADDCIFCGGYTQDTVSGRICHECPADSQSLPGSTDVTHCKCNIGFFGPDGGTCLACSPGTYKPVLGSTLCLNCPSGTIDIDNSMDMLRDTANNTCIACEANKYSLSLVECTDCPINTQSLEGSGNILDCICVVEHEKIGGVCQPCSAGYVKADIGNQLCQACSAGFYDLENENECIQCPSNSFSPSISSDILHCTCNAGYTGPDGSACTSCAAGKYKSITGSSPCTSCASGTWYNGSEPYILNRCISCPDFSNSPTQSYSINHCVCNTGFFREAEDSCRECREDYFCPNQFTETACNLGSSSISTSSTFESCICRPSWFGEPNNCARCLVDHYCPGGNTLLQCPTHSTTLTLGGMDVIDDCVCNAGFHANDQHECIVCPEDHFCFNDTQVTCPPNSTALPQQNEQDDCVCNEYYRKDDTVSDYCVLCNNSLICHGSVDGSADGVIEYCSPASLDHPASVNINQRCVCPGGSFCNDGSIPDSCSNSGDICNNCPADHHCSENQIFACAENTTSPANSFSVESCACKTGYYRANNGQCLICAENSFCVDEVRTSCTSLDANLITFGTGNDDRQDCVCKNGSFRMNTSDLCKLCPSNHFCPSQSVMTLPNIVACESNKYTLERGAHLETQCLCLAGFYAADVGGLTSCLPCPEGYRCAGGNSDPEICDIHMRTANADHTECVCIEGFEEDNSSQCVQCQPGYFKNTIGNAACTLCADETFMHNLTACQPCWNNSESTPDRLTCSCVAPFEKVGQSCNLCAEDQYYDNICVSCPALSSTLGREGQTGITSCQCQDGYYLSGECLPCPANTYGIDGTCRPCVNGSSSSEGSISIHSCTCDASTCQKMVFGQCSGACEDAPHGCSMCQLGFNKSYMSTVGNAEPCLACPLHTYQDELGQTLCKDCDDTRETLLQGRTDINSCLCRKGFEGASAEENSTCGDCSPGYFKNTVSNAMCTACLVGLFTDEYHSTSCQLCSDHSFTTGATLGANTTVSVGSVSEQCVCDLGHFQNVSGSVNFCQPCHHGSFKNDRGMHACYLCGVGAMIHTFGRDELGAVTSEHCQPCPTHSGQSESEVSLLTPMTEITDCLCFPGHDTWSNTTCLSCNDYEFKIDFNLLECNLCEDGKYFINHNQACGICDLIDAVDSQRRHVMQAVNTGNSSLRWGQDEYDCVCDLGYIRQLQACHACAKGSYRNETQILICTLCAPDTYQDEVAAMGCKGCPENSHTVGEGSTDISYCVCKAGYGLIGSDVCTPCPAGTYSPHGDNMCWPCLPDTYSVGSAEACTSCAENERSGATGSFNEGFCNCKPGYGSNQTHPSVCTACPNNTYSMGGMILMNQRPTCTACPNFKSSPPISTSAYDCVCIPGYEDTGSNPRAACTPCADGQYSAGGANQACNLCGIGSISEPQLAATSFSDCLCPAENGLIPLNL